MIERREVLQSVATFEQVMLEASKRPGRYIETPEVIDLHVHQKSVEDVIRLTSLHPRRHEHGRVFFIERDGKLTTRQIIVGGLNEVRFDTVDEIGVYPFVDGGVAQVPKLQQQNRLIASFLHSHPIDSFFSPRDLVLILDPDFEERAATASFLITPKRKLLAMRGKSTPQFVEPADKVDDIVKDKDKKLLLKRFLFLMNKKSETDNIFFDDAQQFRDFVEYMDLQVYEGGVWDQYMKKTKPQEIARDL